MIREIHAQKSFPIPGGTFYLGRPMESEIAKAVEAGKLSTQAAQTLEQLGPGAWCLHKSWGFGRVESVNFLVNQLTVDFKTKKGHAMQLPYAAESLQPIEGSHILARKATDLGAVKKQAADDPAGLVRSILQSYDGRATQDVIVRTMTPDVMSEAEFKRWWESAKKALKKDGHFAIPSKKSQPIELREESVSRGTELLERFSAARQLKEQLTALDQIIKNLDAFEGGALAPVVATIENAARKSQRLRSAQAFELLLARDEISEKASLPPGEGALTVVQLLREEEKRLPDILAEIPAARQKRLLAGFPRAFGDSWVGKALGLMLKCSVRVTAEIARLLQEQNKHEELRRELDRWIRDHSITTEVLYWLCKERNTGAFGDLVTPEVFGAILAALERDQFSTVKRGGRLHDLLIEDRELLPELLENAEPGVVRDSMRKLMMTPVFEELNKRSLFGRIIRNHPEIESMLTGETSEKQEALVVSWTSLTKRKTEYEELITKKIPENTKEISIARSYGDLRENFEFKAAKEMQRVLMRRKSEMEQGLTRARGTNFENPDLTQVSIGTVVTLRNAGGGGETTYSILGAWDSAPERGVISYLAAIGQALLGRKAGEQVELPTETGAENVEIVSIAPYSGPETKPMEETLSE